jgi:formate hydrogenlyase subunit 3/multisubunit Na+/H+ antiporter MnhD subunit
MVFGIVSLIISVVIFLSGDLNFNVLWLKFGDVNIDFSLRAYVFPNFCLMFTSLFAVLIMLFSIKFMPEKNIGEYYGYLLLLLGCVNGTLLSENLIVFILFWELGLIFVYGLIKLGKENSYKTAAKSFYVLGFGDFCLLLGFLLMWFISNNMNLSNINIHVTGKLEIITFILVACGALAKAGAMPFHTWIPDAAIDAPATVMAYVPASLDKILGIYLLGRIVMDFFHITSGLSFLLMAIGSFTIIAAVFMAMVQHDLKKLLSYHAVSQVGYMVLGIGTGIPIGIAGGIFHMLNHAIYKCCLFLTGASVEKQTGTTDLDKLGGLIKQMPWTFVAFFVAALSISGVPPFNGFVSKWMIYQGVIELGKHKETYLNNFWWIFLIVAMFGSALTLASFMKILHATFLGKGTKDLEKTKESSSYMVMPMLVLASFCIVFGVFAYNTALSNFILPSVNLVSFLGFWQSGSATFMIIFGIVIGIIIYFMIGFNKRMREDYSFIGGETLPEEVRITGVDFYQTIKDIKGLSYVYEKSEKGVFDFANRGIEIIKALGMFLFFCIDRLIESTCSGVVKMADVIGKGLSEIHGGLLGTYLYWCMFGIIILLIIL